MMRMRLMGPSGTLHPGTIRRARPARAGEDDADYGQFGVICELEVHVPPGAGEDGLADDDQERIRGE
jgi:hypothetical protein